MRSNDWKRFEFFHEIKHRWKIWYLKLNKQYIMKQIFYVWIMRYWRECESHHDLIISLWISKFSNTFCDINESISMWFDCKNFDKYVNDMKNNRKIDEKNNASNANKFLRTYIDAKNANSNFFDLIKICQKIKSINMRKNQIFSTLFVFLDRVFVFLLIEFLFCKIEYVMIA